MDRPLIAITTGSGPSRSGERASIGAAYLLALQGAGGVPVVLTPQLDEASRTALLDRVDGLVLTGGGDIDPARYGEARHEHTDGVLPERDQLEAAAVAFALGREMPILAICRGMQILNVALGGSLHQHIPDDFETGINHAQTSGEKPRERSEVTHAVAIEEGCRLAAVLGSTSLDVNSMHHQAVKRLGRDLRAVGWAPDGVLEGVELQDGNRWVVGVQWHPEELIGAHDHARRLFERVVEEARRRSGRTLAEPLVHD